MDVFSIAQIDRDRTEREKAAAKEGVPTCTWYRVDPAAMYPAMVDYILLQLEKGEQGDGVIRNRYFPEANSMPREAWDLANTPRDDIGDDDVESLDMRMKALNLCRVWFTELLHRAVRWNDIGVTNPAFVSSQPPDRATFAMGLQITKDPAWRW